MNLFASAGTTPQRCILCSYRCPLTVVWTKEVWRILCEISTLQIKQNRSWLSSQHFFHSNWTQVFFTVRRFGESYVLAGTTPQGCIFFYVATTVPWQWSETKKFGGFCKISALQRHCCCFIYFLWLLAEFRRKLYSNLIRIQAYTVLGASTHGFCIFTDNCAFKSKLFSIFIGWCISRLERVQNYTRCKQDRRRQMWS